VECMALLHDVSLLTNLSNLWQWQLDHVGGYSVCGVYQLLTSHESPQVELVADLDWYNQVPLKVSIFAWRLLCDRLPIIKFGDSRHHLSIKSFLCFRTWSS